MTEAPVKENPVLNSTEVAGLLRICERQVRIMANRGELPFFRIGKRMLFKSTEIKSWIDSQ